MFDTYHRTEYVPYEKTVNITEKKAPTDDIIRLYDEIKEKAYKSILDTISISDNKINFSATLYRDFYTMTNCIGYKAVISEEEYIGKIVTKDERFAEKNIAEVRERIVNDLSKQILHHLNFTQGI